MHAYNELIVGGYSVPLETFLVFLDRKSAKNLYIYIIKYLRNHETVYTYAEIYMYIQCSIKLRYLD